MNLAGHLVIRSVFVAQVVRRYQRKFSTTYIKMQVFTQKKNPITGATEWDVQNEDYDFHQEIARSAFADMLHDTERNKKYQRALQLAIEKMHEDGRKANVLDIGTGTGLLSIMAAKAGADSIVACEAFKPMADCCLKILELNGVADKIKVIPKRSTEITVGDDGDMKEKANILVTEVFDTELIGEGAVSTFSHAHKYLLEKDCIVVPDSAIIYAQVVECPTLWKWNRLNDLADEDLSVILRTPKKIKQCAGSAAVHDLQLSQLPRSSFKELSEQLPVFYYDWSGRTPIDKNRVVKQQFSSLAGGTAHCVFMWWELNMDTEGKIVLSCAPWWAHPNTDFSSERPQDTIPWRDHWMQAVYYLPRDVSLQHNTEATLISCQDEYSLWFYLEDDIKFNTYKRPICECGVHMVLSRTHVSYLNDGKRSKKYLAELREEISTDSVILDLNGSSFLGLAAASMGAKSVYIVETSNINIGIIKDYIDENNLNNVHIIAEPTNKILNEVTNVVADPNFPSAILPWENLKVAFLLYKYSDKFKNLFTILPEACEFWAMPVEFKDLHKIRIPLGTCEGIKMEAFDKLVEDSRSISDEELEAQPLWEYPCWCRGAPRQLLAINLTQLEPTYAADDTPTIIDEQSQSEFTINGFVVWTSWTVGGKKLSSGPPSMPSVGDIVQWDTHTRQAVKILKQTHTLQNTDRWCYQIACDLKKGEFNLQISLVNSNDME